MNTILLYLQIFTGLVSLVLLGLAINKAHRGNPSKRLSKWVIGLAGAFVTLTLVITWM